MQFSHRIRFYIIGLMVLGGFSTILVRLFGIQIERYDEFTRKVPGTSEVSVRIPGIRGLVRDRVGRVLVDNVARYEMQFNLKDIVDGYKKWLAAENRATVRKNREDGKKRELKEFPKRVFMVLDTGGIRRPKEETDMVAIVSEIVLPYLDEIGLYREFNSDHLQRHWRTHGGLVPYTYSDDLTFEEYAIAAEHSLDIPGVTVATRPLRRYIYDSLGSHILGFVNQPDIQKVPPEERKRWNYYVPDDFGADGIEDTMDQYLRGKPGKRVLLKDEKGRIVDGKDEAGQVIGELSYDPPQPGADVWLTIDLRYQFIAEKALREAGIGRGAVVVVAPTTYKTKLKIGGRVEDHWVYAGDILAMASVPSYNPNKFIPSISEEDWDAYCSNDTHPLINRALKDHAPGSTFKIPIAFAGMLGGIDRRPFICGTGAAYGSDVFMKCWINGRGDHGGLYMREAIMRSCNGYFYRYGNAAGITNIEQVTKWMGLGERTGIPLNDEDPGLVPTPNWKRSQGLGNWGSADTAQVSIGQGATEATPLQMAVVAATTANGGKCYKPRLVHKIVEDGVEQRHEPVLRYDLTLLGIPAEKIEVARSGMWDVVNAAGGTARRARSEIAQISGKTGTAQTGRVRSNGDNETNAWFMAFAPYDTPKLAVCVMVENGKAGGVVGAPVGKKIIDEILSIEKFDYAPPVGSLAEAEGNFDFVELVSFDANPTDAFVGDDEPDGSAVAAAPARPVQATRTATRRVAPTVKKAPDQRGSVKPQRKAKRTGLFSRFRRKR